jgi:uncharacterized protein (UPF0147 family)
VLNTQHASGENKVSQNCDKLEQVKHMLTDLIHVITAPRNRSKVISETAAECPKLGEGPNCKMSCKHTLHNGQSLN